MTRSVDTLIFPRWLVTVDPQNRVLENHGVAIDDGKIVEIFPAAERGDLVGKHEISLHDHALMPGLINTHTHAAMSLMRGLADDKALMDWLQNYIWPAEAKQVNPEFVELGTRLAIAESLKGGVTCFNDMYFFPDATAKVVDQTGFRAQLGIIVIDFPSAYGSGPDDYLSKGLALREQYQANPRIGFTLAPHAPYTVADEPLKRIASLSAETGMQVHMHVHETAGEVSMAVDADGRRPLQRLTELGLVNERLLAVHMTQLTDDEIQQAATEGLSVLHCPESNLKLASGISPVAKLSSAGVNVCIGTDGAASNNDLDMFGEMRTAALLAKGHSGDATAVPVEQALRMATINGAKALGIDSVTGSIEIGKAADLIAVDLGGIESTPIYNPVSQLVYATGRHQVTDVWVAGKQLLNHRSLMCIDEQRLLSDVNNWHKSLSDTD